MPIEEELAALKAEVAQLRQLVEQLYYRSGVPKPSGGTPTLDDPPPAVVEAVRAGNLILAIKEWRAVTGRGLAESKREVEELARRLGR